LIHDVFDLMYCL